MSFFVNIIKFLHPVKNFIYKCFPNNLQLRFMKILKRQQPISWHIFLSSSNIFQPQNMSVSTNSEISRWNHIVQILHHGIAQSHLLYFGVYGIFSFHVVRTALTVIIQNVNINCGQKDFQAIADGSCCEVPVTCTKKQFFPLLGKETIFLTARFV